MNRRSFLKLVGLAGVAPAAASITLLTKPGAAPKDDLVFANDNQVVQKWDGELGLWGEVRFITASHVPDKFCVTPWFLRDGGPIVLFAPPDNIHQLNMSLGHRGRKEKRVDLNQ